MKRGFTLIEILIASGIFALVSVVGATTLTGIYKLEGQTEIIRSYQQSVRLPLETMARDIRLAKEVVAINPNGFKLIDQGNAVVEYKLSGGEIVKITAPVSTSQSLTADDVIVDEFNVSGKLTTPSFIDMKIKVHSTLDTSAVPTYLEARTVAVPREYNL